MVPRSHQTQSLDWFTTDLGNRFQAIAAAELVRIVPRTYFSVALDLGPGTLQYWQFLDAGLGLRVNPARRMDAQPTGYYNRKK